MRIVLFYRSLISDGYDGNTHFLRGIATELVERGYDVRIYEPQESQAVQYLRDSQDEAPVVAFHASYPKLISIRYRLAHLDLDDVLDGADLVIVHEWNDPVLVQRVGEHLAPPRPYRLLFHDTHHHALTTQARRASSHLHHYDGVLASGNVIRDAYLRDGWAQRAWTWHQAADVRVFRPLLDFATISDVVWMGNGDDMENLATLQEFLIDPVKQLGLQATTYGVRYGSEEIAALAEAGIRHAGWLPTHLLSQVCARHKVMIHVPSHSAVPHLPGIPSIRLFEALACGIPLICARWEDSEGLFTPEKDYLVAHDAAEMTQHLRMLLQDDDRALAFAIHGRQTIMERHTCAHRVDELMRIYDTLQADKARVLG